MSFLKQILKPFIEFDPEVPKDETKNNVPIKNQQVDDEVVHHPLVNEEGTVTAPTASLPPVQDVDMSIPLPEHVQYFEALIAKANQENPLFIGPDYKEFIDAKLDIDDITDETLKYKTAFNILKSSGLTKDKLVSTGHEYLNIIGRDLNAFQTAHAQQYKKELSQKELDLKTKVYELQVITQRLNVLKSEINLITKEINQSQQKLNTTKNSFLMAGEMKQQEIQSELNKIASLFG